MLSKVDIEHEMKKYTTGYGGIGVIPSPDDIDSCGIDLRLGSVNEYSSWYLDQGDFCLGRTMERIILPNYICGLLDGKSSLARKGLCVHATAHTIQPGWDGTIVLEFFNAGRDRIYLEAGMKICAIKFFYLNNPTTKPYNGIYKNGNPY